MLNSQLCWPSVVLVPLRQIIIDIIACRIAERFMFPSLEIERPAMDATFRNLQF
jgi:hypothetical protein